MIKDIDVILALYGTTLMLLIISILPTLPSDHWVIRVWEFPRLQIVLLLLINAVLCVSLLSGWDAILCSVVSLLCIFYQAYWIYPYTGLHSFEVKGAKTGSASPSLRILTSNVLMTNRSADKLIEHVKNYQPDILVTLESDTWWQHALTELHSSYPHRVNVPLDNLYGMHVFSRLELTNISIDYLIEEGVPSIHCYAVVDEDIAVKCHFIHPAPPSPTENESATPRDKELILIAKQIEPKRVPTIVAGDLNDVAWSPTTSAFRTISGLSDPRIGRGFFNTFHTKYPFARWPLDHIFHSDHFDVKEIRRLSSIGSDHFPLLSELVIERRELE